MTSNLVAGAGSAPFPPEETLGSIVEDVLGSLQGYGIVTDQMCSTTTDLPLTGRSVSLDDGEAVTRGMVEIGDELMFVSSSRDGQITIPAWGRALKGTTARAWPAGTRVTVAPVYPRAVVRRAVRSAIYGLAPALFAVREVEVQAWSHTILEVPADAERILSIRYSASSDEPSELIRDWRLFQLPGDSKALHVAASFGGTLFVQYACAPTPPADEAGSMASTGLPASTRDVIVLGAAINLLPWVDAARLPADSVPSDVEDQAKPIGSAAQITQTLRSQYTAALQRERSALLLRFPVPLHGIR